MQTWWPTGFLILKLILKVKSIMGEYKQFNADVVVRDPDATVDDLIDTIEGYFLTEEIVNILNACML